MKQALLFLSLMSLGSLTFAADTYEEIDFLKTFAGKSAEYVITELGEPASVIKRENAGGTVEFWIYQDRVQQGSSDKLYRFTQIGIVNDAVETLGHTNRDPQ
jgi:phage protein U